MKTIFKVLDWSRFLPYLITEILFLLLTYPGLKNLSIHIDAGYASYIIASSAIVLAAHVGLAFMILKCAATKEPSEKKIVLRFFERFNILFGIVIVIVFEGTCSSLFQYREWAYGVSRSETIIEKINDNWNDEQVEKSRMISKELDRSARDYTEDIYLKWKSLKRAD